MNTIHKGLAVLMSSAVTGEKRQLPEDFTLEAALPIIKKQNLTPLVFQGALNCGIPNQDPIMTRMMQQYIMYMLRSEKQMCAIQQIFTAFEENGIDYLPLKGCNMKSLYPKPELRTMGDADILIRMEQYERIVPIIKQMGFCQHAVSEYDFEWKSEALFLELHKHLVPPSEQDLFSYFGNGWSRAVKVEGNRYTLSTEDAFVYLFVHMTKHYRNYGIGSRHILDLFVYCRAYPDMDEAYIEEEMAKLHLLVFYRNIKKLLTVWFEDAASNEITDYITEYIFSGGSFGSLENGIVTEAMRISQNGKAVHGSKVSVILSMFFPSAKALELRYPVLQKLPALLPFVWVVRWFTAIFFRWNRNVRRMNVMLDMTDVKVNARQQVLNFVGLDYNLENENQA